MSFRGMPSFYDLNGTCGEERGKKVSHSLKNTFPLLMNGKVHLIVLYYLFYIVIVVSKFYFKSALYKSTRVIRALPTATLIIAATIASGTPFTPTMPSITLYTASTLT